MNLGSYEGIWHKYLEFDDNRFWSFNDLIAHKLVYEKNPLPSDSIYRKDSIYW